jgi:hypothetical protein
MANPIQPFILSFRYQVTISGLNLSHHLNLGINVTSDPAEDTAFEDVEVTLNSGATVTLDTYMSTLFPLIAPNFHTGVEFPIVDLWAHPDGDPNGIYISSAAIGDNGTAVGSPTSAGEMIQTYRATGDGLMKLSLQESSHTTQGKLAYPSGLSPLDNLSIHILGVGGAIRARGGGKPIAGLFANGGQNEATWRRRNRPD